MPLLFVLIVVIAAGVRLARRERIPANIRDREDLSSMSWPQVERAARALFEREGYGVNGVRRNSEAGVDLVLHRGYERIFVRLDHWKVWSVTAEPLRRLNQLVGREGAAHGVVLTAGEFSREAREYASAAGLELLDGATLGALLEDLEPALDLAA